MSNAVAAVVNGHPVPLSDEVAPADFTPVCTTEFMTFARRSPIS